MRMRLCAQNKSGHDITTTFSIDKNRFAEDLRNKINNIVETEELNIFKDIRVEVNHLKKVFEINTKQKFNCLKTVLQKCGYFPSKNYTRWLND
ncbi:MAG: hypothetical protein GY714_03870 [Desulfobacterales bacterium]|nr:hypothetical protein [Desulfobacterales bacterium]MCP4161182.1 hypothetical protein [Deltaproteobacteria bacterium]